VVVLDNKSRPAPVKRPTATTTAQQQQQQQQPQPQPQPQPQQEQPSTRSTLRNAFKALLWPIRALPAKMNHVFPEEAPEEALSQFVTTGATKISPYQYYSHDGRPAGEEAPSPGPYSPSSAGPLTMQYYHVDSAENDIYQQWVNLLGPSMGGAWVPVNQNQAGHRDFSSRRQPAVPELFGRAVLAELPSDSMQPV
jgi:hypothetical protein